MNKNKGLKRFLKYCEWEMGNEKQEMRNEDKIMIEKKWFFYWFVKLIYKKWIITGLIGKKSCKKKNILKKKLLSFLNKTKKL